MQATIDLSENIFSEMGLENLSDEKKLALLQQMTMLVEKRVMLRLIEALTDDEAIEAEKLADRPEELLEYLGSRVPNMDKIIAHETDIVREEIRSAIEEDTALKA